MKPTIAHHNGIWRVHVGEHVTGAWATKERAERHARNIETMRAKKRALDELERAAEALNRMETRR